MTTSDDHATAPTFMTMRTFELDPMDISSEHADAKALAARMAGARADGEHFAAYAASPALQSLRGENPDPRFAVGRGAGLTIVHDREPRAEPSAPSPEGLVGQFSATWALDEHGRWADASQVLRQPHVGIQVAYGMVADRAWRATIAAWYRDIHAPDLLEVDGVIGCVRFVSSDQSEPRAGEHLVVFLLGEDPATVMARVRARVPAWRDAGRTPSPGRSSRAVFNGPFLRVSER